MRRSAFIFAFLMFSPTLCVAEEAVIIAQSGPLEVTSYTANYRENILHKVALKNVSDQRIDAYEVTFLSFDVFKERMGRNLGGISIESFEPGKTTSGSWRQTTYASFKFKKYGIGVCYVSKVRLADGSIWTADQDFVLSELQRIQEDLTADIFENEEG